MSDPRSPRVRAAEETILDLYAKIEQLTAQLKTAVWSDSEECKMLTADNERLRAENKRAWNKCHELRNAGNDAFYAMCDYRDTLDEEVFQNAIDVLVTAIAYKEEK